VSKLVFHHSFLFHCGCLVGDGVCRLIDKSKNIQFEAFHVFKVFVANPRKPPEVTPRHADLL